VKGLQKDLANSGNGVLTPWQFDPECGGSFVFHVETETEKTSFPRISEQASSETCSGCCKDGSEWDGCGKRGKCG
jgi:hypothetical protein